MEKKGGGIGKYSVWIVYLGIRKSGGCVMNEMQVFVVSVEMPEQPGKFFGNVREGGGVPVRTEGGVNSESPIPEYHN